MNFAALRRLKHFKAIVLVFCVVGHLAGDVDPTLAHFLDLGGEFLEAPAPILGDIIPGKPKGPALAAQAVHGQLEARGAHDGAFEVHDRVHQVVLLVEVD